MFNFFNYYIQDFKILCTCAINGPVLCKSDKHYCICSKKKYVCRSDNHFKLCKKIKSVKTAIKKETSVFIEQKIKCQCAKSNPADCTNDDHDCICIKNYDNCRSKRCKCICIYQKHDLCRTPRHECSCPKYSTFIDFKCKVLKHKDSVFPVKKKRTNIFKSFAVKTTKIENTYDIFVDGSYVSKHPEKIGSWAFIVVKDNNVIYHEKGLFPQQRTNNTDTELYASYHAILWAYRNNFSANIFHDNEDIVLSFWNPSNYIKSWYSFEVHDKIENISFIKVKAHNGDDYNRMVDYIAKSVL